MILTGNCFEVLQTLASESVQTCVTSPPYWGLRDYGVSGQLGLESTPDAYVNHMVSVFREARRVLKKDGTLWLNLGDSYNAYNGNRGRAKGLNKNRHDVLPKLERGHGLSTDTLKNKDLVGIPWRVAFALQADGWYLRQDIIWHKPNPMPESVRDRCTKAHEYIFLLAKSERYHFDVDAIKEPAKYFGPNGQTRSPYGQGFTRTAKRAGKNAFRGQGHMRGGDGPADRAGRDVTEVGIGFTRQKRSVWTVSTKPFKGAHFATFPPDLIEPCILAGSKLGDTVLDPFFGAGTTGLVALKHGRKYIGIELNPAYVEIAKERLNVAQLKLEGA